MRQKMTHWIPWNELSRLSSCSCVWIPAMSGRIAACASWKTVLAASVWVGTGVVDTWGCNWSGLEGMLAITVRFPFETVATEPSWCKEVLSFAAVGGTFDMSRLRSWYQLPQSNQLAWQPLDLEDVGSIYRARTTPIIKWKFVTMLRAWK